MSAPAVMGQTATPVSLFAKMKSSLSDLSVKVKQISKIVFDAGVSALKVTGSIIAATAIVAAGIAAVVLGLAALITLVSIPILLANHALAYIGLIPHASTAILVL